MPDTYKNGDCKEYAYVDDSTVFGFFGPYRFLSNFHLCEVEYNGNRFPSTEHAYMVAKCIQIQQGLFGEPIFNGTQLSEICALSCSQVRRWGQKVQLRPDWEAVKISIMEQINWDKYSRNPQLKTALLATGSRELIEANSWGDSFWGYNVRTQSGVNNLGKLLMRIRARLL